MTCLESFCDDIRSRVRQCRARADYQLNRWRASRSRRKWLQREMEYRKELQIILRSSAVPAVSCYDDEEYPEMREHPEPLPRALGTNKLESEPGIGKKSTKDGLQYKIASAETGQETHFRDSFESLKVDTVIDIEEGVSVLSPQRLSERLSENALAREAVGESDLELAQYLKDERIALFLQNDEFISELRSNQEFMSALQREHDGDSELDEDNDYDDGGQSHRGRRISARKGEGAGGIVTPPLDDATFKERLSTMGKASRKKFAQIAKVFSRGKRGTSARSLLPSVGGSASTNGKDLLMSSDPLIDDYDEDRPQSSSDPMMSSPRNHP